MKPGPHDLAEPEWPAQMKTTDAAEDKVVACREDRARRGAGPVQWGCQAAAVFQDWGDQKTCEAESRV